MSNLETLENQTDSSKIGYVERFEQERLDWTTKVKGISARFKLIDDMVEVQVDLYSTRQQGVEYTQQLSILASKIRKQHLTEWKKAYDALTHNEDYRYSDKERAKLADEKTSSIKLKSDILQSHIDFFKETIKTIDSMIFGVKHRIEIEDFKRGNK